MRSVLAGLATLICVGLASSAHAERHMFIIINDATYGIDGCLAKGDRCGAAVANAYCRSRRFTTAASYHKVNRDDVTGGIRTDDSEACGSGRCNDLVAIVCTR